MSPGYMEDLKGVVKTCAACGAERALPDTNFLCIHLWLQGVALIHQERFDEIRTDFLREIAAAGTESEVLDIKGRYTGKKRGVLQEFTTSRREVSSEERQIRRRAVIALKTRSAALV